MKLKYCLFFIFFVLISFSGCGKENYLYMKKDAPQFKQKFPIKELRGSNAIDLLWVIDNSGSMANHQQALIANAATFIDEFVKKKLDWKMGIISTDEYEAPYAGMSGAMPLNASVFNPVAAFNLTINQLGTNGSGSEKTFTPILKSLRNDPTFLRPNSPFAIIMITDAAEQSGISTPFFLSTLATLTQDRQLLAYGVYASDDFSCDGEGWIYAGSPYEEFIKAVSVGQVFPLCRDFGISLANIAHDIVTRVTHSAIYLTTRPNTSTLKVIYQGQELPAGPVERGGLWIYDYRLNAVVFNNLDFAINDTDSVQVIYED